ncbi:HSP20-like chaperone [Piromyces finnis]|uniref:HSP20-like chaperone n=1 Tax=Piromyces finnis TaxID=1754191 RepID=A0A1Y1VJV8_9FUNG|nr:HSP20-like chaperone [Piromyces finnis]|eukprot:ORX57321.1 HSP20-like chaperone [Piromyces finnis]
MSLYIYSQPIHSFENSLFDDFNNDHFDNDHFLDALIPGSTYNTLIPFYPRRRGHRRNRNSFDYAYNTLEKQLNKIFNDDNKFLTDFEPRINLSKDKNNYYIHADLPGMAKDKIKMEVDEERTLTISGERENIYKNNNDNSRKEKQENEKEQTSTTTTMDGIEMEEDQKNNNNNNNGHKYSVMECSYGIFSRSFTIPEDGNIDNIQAKMENGVLEIIINKIKTQKSQTRSIQIQ